MNRSTRMLLGRLAGTLPLLVAVAVTRHNWIIAAVAGASYVMTLVAIWAVRAPGAAGPPVHSWHRRSHR